MVERLQREGHRFAGVGVAVGADLGDDGRVEERAVEQGVVVVEQELHHGPVVAVDRAAGDVDTEHAVGAGQRTELLRHDLRRTAGERDRDQLHREEPTDAASAAR